MSWLLGTIIDLLSGRCSLGLFFFICQMKQNFIFIVSGFLDLQCYVDSLVSDFLFLECAESPYFLCIFKGLCCPKNLGLKIFSIFTLYIVFSFIMIFLCHLMDCINHVCNFILLCQSATCLCGDLMKLISKITESEEQKEIFMEKFSVSIFFV